MKIISWNLNGIRSVIKKEKFYSLFEKEDPDIICLQEVRGLPSQVVLENKFINKYPYRYWNNPVLKKGYSGVAIFCKNEPLNVILPEIDNEGRVITVQFDFGYVTNVYVPNSGTKFEYRVQKWDHDFRNYVEQFDRSVICGDFNVARKRIDTYGVPSKDSAGFTKEERANFKLLLQTHVDVFRKLYPETVKYSWWSNMYRARERNHGWRIDYFLAKNVDFFDSDILTDHTGSDHAPCILILK
jgi:exodeoxyribonuclease-3